MYIHTCVFLFVHALLHLNFILKISFGKDMFCFVANVISLSYVLSLVF